MSEELFDLGIVGLAVMGRNLALNMADHGFSVMGYNRDPSRVNEFLTEGQGKSIAGTSDLAEFARRLKPPRTVVLLVAAGSAVDAVLGSITPHLDKGDLVVDLGNSYFGDTNRRLQAMQATGYEFLGAGVSGGEEGARHGPAIMVGGSSAAWARIQPVFEAVAARAEDGKPCAARLGEGSSGHYVKMVHNGIEYAMMQVLAEAYDLMSRGAGMSNDQMADVFGEWARGEFGGFLIEISEAALRKSDPETGGSLIDVVLDVGQGKGTGKWTSQDAMNLGIPVPAIDAAVTARNLSALKDQRLRAADLYPATGSSEIDLAALRSAVYGAMVLAYCQGFALLAAASAEYGYNLHLGQVASVWRNGCIIRSRLLSLFMDAFARHEDLPNPLLSREVAPVVWGHVGSMAKIVAQAGAAWIPVPALSASLDYLLSYRSARLPASLIQAQRDTFGAHTYARTDRPGAFHSDWMNP